MSTAASWFLAVFAALQAANPTPPAPAQTYPPAFPRQNATKLLETDRIVVWDIVWPKGQPSPLHRHVFDQVGTYYQTGGRAITQVNGTKSQNTTPVGNISTTRKGTTHIEEGTTDPPLRAVFIEMKRDMPSDRNADRSPAPPLPGAKQVHSEDRVTVWDFTWSAGATPANARYDRDTTLVWLTPGTLRIQKDRGQGEVQTVKPGTFWYRARGTVETEELAGGTPRVIIFEFR
jgi:quercetin dioxygenase-like cupin family protein